MILLLGENGQLARSLAELNWSEEVMILGRRHLDLSDPSKVKEALDRHVPRTPRLIFNAAAYTAVDKAESETRLAEAINAESVGQIAQWAQGRGTGLVHFSTDYVYAGKGDTPMDEESPISPLNAYGQTKRHGEELLLEACEAALIFRVSWVFSPFGSNFVRTMLRLGQQHETLRIVSDQVGSPMCALSIAQLMHRILNHLPPQKIADRRGIYNLSSAPYTSWNLFAEEIFRLARESGWTLNVRQVLPIASEEYVTPAQRPTNSRMSDSKFRMTFADQLAPWTEGLACTLRRLSESN